MEMDFMVVRDSKSSDRIFYCIGGETEFEFEMGFPGVTVRDFSGCDAHAAEDFGPISSPEMWYEAGARYAYYDSEPTEDDEEE